MSPLGFVYWITGLSGAGKTTFANLLHKALDKKGTKTVLLDGDMMREVFGHTSEHSREARLALAYKYARLARFLSCQGVNVLCATISLFHEVQRWNRQNMPRYREVFIHRDLTEIEKEDVKGIYRTARAGTLTNVVGLDIKAEFPQTPDLIVPHVSLEFLQDYIERAVKLL